MDLLYSSTRNSKKKFTASQAILKGLADDGGLFVPESIPALDVSIEELSKMSYQETAYAVMKKFLTDFTEEELKNCIDRAYDSKFDTPQIAPLVNADGAYYLELFHGSTIAFKDMALSMTGALVSSSSYGSNGDMSEEDIINLIRELNLITISIEGFDFDKLSVTDILQAIHKVTDRELMSMASSCNREVSYFLDNLDEASLYELAICGKKKKASERVYTSADEETSPFSRGKKNEDNGEALSSKDKSNKGKDTTDDKKDTIETLRDKARRTVALFLEKFPSEVFVSDLTRDSNVQEEITNVGFYTEDIRKEFGEVVFDIFMSFIKGNLNIFSKKVCEVIDKRDSLDKFDRYDFLVKSCNF